MAEKPPCHVWRGNNRLHGLHMRGNGSVYRFSAFSPLMKLFFRHFGILKIIPLTPFRLHFRPKMPTFFQVRRRWKLSLLVFFFLPLQISTACIRTVGKKILTHQNSRLSLLFCVRLSSGLVFWIVSFCFLFFLKKVVGFFYLRSLASLRLKAPFLIDCVFDPETGWQLSLTAAWLNARRSSHCGGLWGKNLWHQHALFHWQGYSVAEFFFSKLQRIPITTTTITTPKATYKQCRWRCVTKAADLFFFFFFRRAATVTTTGCRRALRTSWSRLT